MTLFSEEGYYYTNIPLTPSKLNQMFGILLENISLQDFLLVSISIDTLSESLMTETFIIDYENTIKCTKEYKSCNHEENSQREREREK